MQKYSHKLFRHATVVCLCLSEHLIGSHVRMINRYVRSQNEFKAEEFICAVEYCLAHSVQSEKRLDLLLVNGIFLWSNLPSSIQKMIKSDQILRNQPPKSTNLFGKISPIPRLDIRHVQLTFLSDELQQWVFFSLEGYFSGVPHHLKQRSQELVSGSNIRAHIHKNAHMLLAGSDRTSSSSMTRSGRPAIVSAVENSA